MLGEEQMMTKFRLLIIEEHKAVRQALETRLRSSPLIEVVGAMGTAGAMSIVGAAGALSHPADRHLNGRKSSPDIALLSIKRGNDRQLDVTLDLVKRLVRWGAAVIVLTSYADDVERELLLQAGASRYLLKDVNTPQLIAEIEGVIAEKARAAEAALAL
jgi:DNA-binding NarL/FixJ family response regulator